MDTQKLRQRILDLAIRGKLVPQDPNDEPASVLLDRIRAEKERLIAEGKIKRPKTKRSTDKSHYQNFTPPFEIPKSWRWVRLEEIAYFGGGKTPSTDVRSYWENGTNLWVTSKDMKSSHIKDSKIKITDCALSQMTLYAKGTLLLVTRSGILRHSLPIAILDYPATVNQDIKTISCFSSNLNKFVLWAIKAQEELILKDFHKDGTTVDSIDFDKFKSLSLPIPPKEEQKRIISQIELLFGYTSQIDDSRDHITKLVSATKSKILDLAMQGKLVPQDSTDEPAADMLRRINPKARIITDNPHSWNIPNGWCWVMVSDVFAPMQRKLPEGDNFWYIDIDSVDNKRNVAYPKNICTTTAPSRASRFTQKGDVVFSMVRPYLRNIALVPEDDCIASTGFYVFHPLDAILSKYSYILTLSSFFVDGLNSFMKGDNSPSINKNNVESFVIPLPPLNEQKRIVAKIEELYSVLDEIEASLRS